MSAQHFDRPPLHEQARVLADSPLLAECLRRVPHLAEPLAELLTEVARSRIARVAETGLIFIHTDLEGTPYVTG